MLDVAEDRVEGGWRPDEKWGTVRNSPRRRKHPQDGLFGCGQPRRTAESKNRVGRSKIEIADEIVNII